MSGITPEGATATVAAPKRGRRRHVSYEQEIETQPWAGLWRDILGGGFVRSVVAIIAALFVGSLLVVFIDENVQAALGYFFARPSDALDAAGQVIAGTYRSLWQGAIFSPRTGFTPITSTLMWATPLIAAGLGVAIGFRAGLFNIGGRGQMLFAALFAGFAGASLPLPPGCSPGSSGAPSGRASPAGSRRRPARTR